MGGWHWEKMKYEGYGRNIEDLYNIDNEEQVTVHICGFDGIQRGNFQIRAN